jgi:hypothetical protein
VGTYRIRFPIRPLTYKDFGVPGGHFEARHNVTWGSPPPAYCPPQRLGGPRYPVCLPQLEKQVYALQCNSTIAWKEVLALGDFRKFFDSPPTQAPTSGVSHEDVFADPGGRHEKRSGKFHQIHLGTFTGRPVFPIFGMQTCCYGRLGASEPRNKGGKRVYFVLFKYCITD